MEIFRSGSRPVQSGQPEWMAGTARLERLFQTPGPGGVHGLHVTFEPGARTAWHSHPLGQTLIVTAGLGWVQPFDGEKQKIELGDVVWFPPGEKHWHGASATGAMSHIAIQQAVDGKTTEWLEHVSADQYHG